jgi:hypothetical protein
MEDAKRSEMIHAVEVIKEFFFERLFSIHYKYHDHRIGKSNFEIASGFCTLGKEVPLFVTCAHFITALEEKMEKGLIQEVSIGIPCKPSRLLKFDLDDDYLACFKYWDSHPCQDFAIGPCDREFLDAMTVGGAKFLKMYPVETAYEDKGLYFLFGFSAADSRAKVNDLFYVPTPHGHKMRHTADMGALAPRLYQLAPPIVLEDGRLESTILTDNVESVVGLSGGFIVKIFPGKELRQFEFIGIQSEQSTFNDRVTSVRYSSSEVVVDCLDYFIESLSISGES